VFALALCLYLYLPIRTNAGAAIHWGDPNTLDRFIGHVTAKTHRTGYVLSHDPFEYIERGKEMGRLVFTQLGVFLPFGFIGWLTISSIRWRLFFVGIILFDVIYAVFLNIVSPEITPFLIHTLIVLSFLTGLGVAQVLRKISGFSKIGTQTRKLLLVSLSLLPLLLLFFRYGPCDQSDNYTAYEHATNILRSAEQGSTLIVGGDNNVFPLIYGRMVERAREDVNVYDRYNLIFKWPVSRLKGSEIQKGEGWESIRTHMERQLIRDQAFRGVFLALFNPQSIEVPNGFRSYPYGVAFKVIRRGVKPHPDELKLLWRYYSAESFYKDIARDYMTRQVTAYYHFSLGRYLFKAGFRDKGIDAVKLASNMGYNDEILHSDIAVFFTKQGLFKEAESELEKALRYAEDQGMVYNNWGYYYNAVGDHEKSITSLTRATQLSPKNHIFYNNLGLALLDAERTDEAEEAFRKSTRLLPNQPRIKRLLNDFGKRKDKGGL
jgi:hypothetical protein